MTVHAARMQLQSRMPRADRETVTVAAIAVAASVVAGRMVGDPSLLRLGFAACVAAFVLGLGLKNPRPLLYGLIAWLAALGLIRRLLSVEFSSAGPADPLLLIYPLALLVLLAAAADRGAFKNRTSLGTAVLVLIAIIVLGALNPLQGSLFAGVSSLVFFVHMLAFWIGRGLCDDQTLRRTFFVFAAASIPAALYGMYQISVGFPSWDQHWIDTLGYAALQVGNTVRPFSSFSSASEYATFLSVAIMAWLALGRRYLRLPGLAVIALLVVSVVYQSSRGSVVQLLGAFAIIAAARRRLPLGVALACAVAALSLLPLAIRSFAPDATGTDAKSQLLAHQVEGLSNPFDPEASTAGAHISLIVGGIEEGFQTPLGHGLSSVTIAGSKFGGTIVAGTEADPSNAAVALGLPGLFAYIFVLVIGYTKAYRLASRTRDPLAMLALGICTVMFPQWLNGGQYAVALLPWLLLGWVDRRTALLDTEQRAAAEPIREERP